MKAVIGQAVTEVRMLEAAGYDGIIVENAWDIPFLPPDQVGPETIAGLSVVVGEVVARTAMPVGVNCLANAVEVSVAVAAATGAAFVRANQWVNAYVANEGLIEGRAGRVMRYRRSIEADHVTVWADVKVKLGSHALTADRSLSEQARDADWFNADALIVTGSRLADPPVMSDLTVIHEASRLALVVGSGVTTENVGSLLTVADAAIVGSALKQHGVWSGRMSEAAVQAIARSRDEATVQRPADADRGAASDRAARFQQP